MNEFEHIAYSIKWHRAEIIHSMVEERLELYAHAVDHDTRPLITPRMREQSRQEWDRLWNLNRTEECPVCHEKPAVWDGPMNSDIPTRCPHFLCTECWQNLYDRYASNTTDEVRCPICRDDVSNWAEFEA